MSHDKGDTVTWNWGGGEAEGVVREVFCERVEKTIKGSTIVRSGEADNPAYLIKQDDGDEVLKLHSELSSG